MIEGRYKLTGLPSFSKVIYLWCSTYKERDMAEESRPPPVQKQPSVDTYKWSNRKEDYKLLDVIGEQDVPSPVLAGGRERVVSRT